MRSAEGALGNCDRVGGWCQGVEDERRVELQEGSVKSNLGRRYSLRFSLFSVLLLIVPG
jgi:hypothetical protein